MRLSTLRWPLALLLVVFALPASSQNYAQTTITPGFVDIGTASATPGTLITSGDDVLSATQTFPTGFSFPFFGTAQTQFKVSTNGWLTFVTTATSSTALNSALPSSVVPNGLLAPLWDDLNAPTTAPSGGVRGRLDDRGTPGDATDDRFIVQWNGYFYNVTTQVTVFQIQMYASGVVEYHYSTLTTPQTDYTVGVENVAGSVGVQTYYGVTDPTVGTGTPATTASAFRYTFVVATAPIFAINPSTTQTLGTAGACSSTSSLSTTFTVTNNGVGTLLVTGASVTTGTGFTVSTANLPASLASGQSVTLPVTFTPAAGQTGAASTQLTVSYNDGTAQTSAPITINATATNASAAFATGSQGSTPAGIAFRNSQTNGCAAGSALPAPSAALVPFTGHTRIDAGFVAGSTSFPALDDGSYRLTAAQLDALLGAARGDFRFFGRRVDSLWVNSNVNVTFGSAQPSFYGGQPSATGGGSIQVGAMDVSLNTTTAGTNVSYASDNAGVGGTPGVFLGTADVDGDGDQDIVVTWYHAYDYNSVVYNGTAGSTASFFTSQLIILPANALNEDARIEMRFPSGNDANGVPWRLNTAGAPVENDVNIGLSNQQGTASAEYHEDTVGGPMYDGAASLGVSFVPETQATASGVAGYRTMGAPVTGYTVGRLADLNLVQSVVGQYPNFASDNLFTFDGTAYVPAANVTDVLAPGRGFLWYLFNINQIPANPADGAGTSRSYALPMPLQGTGQTPSAAVTVPLTATGSGFNLVANPFRASVNASAATIASWAVGGTLASAVPQAYNPATGSFTVGLPGDIATAWQGFFIQNNTTGGATSLSVPTAAQTTGGTFVGLTADAPTGVLAFRLAGTDAATGAATTDVAAALAVAAELATDGWDLLDASKLAPLAAAYATVGFQGTGPDGQPAVKAQESRPAAAEAFDVPLVVDAVGTSPALTLSWAGLDALPATWALELRDLVTGQTVDLRTTSAYAFEQDAAPALTLAPEALMARTTTAAQAKATDAPRFVLHVTTGRTTAGEGEAITEFALAAPAPNPTAGAARVSFDVPTAGAVSVAVYDLLGRRVAVLAEGTLAAGRHEASLEAGALAPGVYVVRMQAGTFTAVRRVTVVR